MTHDHAEHEHDHQHDHEQGEPQDLSEMFTKIFWDERYATSDRVWSGRPNAALVDLVGDLEPGPGAGTALDAGCGEGADVVWLASRGWQVTGTDVSDVALERAAGHAAERGVADRTSWFQADLYAGDPIPGGFDLVTASFVHVPPDKFDTVYRALADAVAPGGSLVVLAHHPDDTHTGLRNSDLASLLFTPQQVIDVLDPGAWEVVVAATPTRDQLHEGTVHHVTDTVVRAVRRP